jgi:hypothetical protein
MEKAAAFGHNDVAFIAWSYEAPIPDCLGFAVYRREKKGKPEPLPAWVGFEGETNPDWKASTTEVWPVQKFSWRDLTARRGATYTYEIVPMVGTPGKLKPDTKKRLVTEPVHLTPVRSRHIRAYFNRGILSTQSLAHDLPKAKDGTPSYQSLLDHITRPGDRLRNRLAGQIIEGVTFLLQRAKRSGGHCYCALYELNDPELVPLLDDPHVSLVLSTAGTNDSTNADARRKLHGQIDITDRLLGRGHIGHNKFIVYVDGGGSPRSVLTGSTNWTYTGLCGQSNNALVIDDPKLAQAYLDYWHRIKDECPPAVARAEQGAGYRKANATSGALAADGATGHAWFSPNTSRQKKPKAPPPPPRPIDLEEVFALLEGAKHGILFLLFQPGSPSVLDPILERQAKAKPKLFIRGAATDQEAIEDYTVTLYHRTGAKPENVAAASALDDQFAFWQRELLKSSPGAHAIIHDKILVVDPFTPDCAVVTGSHNLGYQASYANDDNLAIVKGHQKLAEAYAVHVMDVYDHYRWRWRRETQGDDAYQGLKRQATWQNFYFTSAAARAEVAFWLQPGVS